MEKGDIDVVVIGYITQDTIALVDEDGNREDYNACGGVSSYFSMVTSALEYKTGIVTPVGDDFFQDYIDNEIVDRFNLSDDDVLRIRDYVDTHPASAERLKSGLKEYLENEIGLDKQRVDALSEDIAYKAIFNPLHAAKYIDNTGYRYIKGENTSKITVLVPSSGYTVGIVDHRLPKIEAADIPDKYLKAKALHIGALF
ncbi:MAG TPA: hypothetical protein EYP80_02190, partial [Candidatus Aenigmarchaeota archaeon]|nr:hypothetical protein [Candidatus Aenigmarchaeota archaeon]